MRYRPNCKSCGHLTSARDNLWRWQCNLTKALGKIKLCGRIYTHLTYNIFYIELSGFNNKNSQRTSYIYISCVSGNSKPKLIFSILIYLNCTSLWLTLLCYGDEKKPENYQLWERTLLQKFQSNKHLLEYVFPFNFISVFIWERPRIFCGNDAWITP